MKSLASAMLLCLASSSALAGTAVQGGSFDLYSEPNYVSSSCNLGTGLILDRGKILGDVAVLEDFVKGTCKIAVRPNTRFTKLTFVRSNCGSKIYQGSFVNADTFVLATITDHRTRRCKDLVPAKVIVTLEPSEGAVTTLYSQDQLPAETLGE